MRFIYALLVMLVYSTAAFATHFIGGYIQATPLTGQPLTYQITVTMYFNGGESIGAAYATEGLYVCFGDNGAAQLVKRSSSQFLPTGQGTSPRILISEYTTTYAYNGPGVYAIQVSSSNRSPTVNAGNAPRAFSLRTSFQIGAVPNRTPVMSLPASGLQFSLNQRVALPLAATDLDGDSLTYSLAYPLTITDQSPESTTFCSNAVAPLVPFQFPNDVRQAGTYRLSSQTGLLNWDVPVEAGQYAVALIVSEWRAGSLLSQTQHELTLTIVDRGGVPVTPPAYEPAKLALITAVADADHDGLSLSVSPNPIIGETVMADLLLSHAQTVTMELLDSQGRVYKRVRLDQLSKRHQYLFDLAGKPAGLYLIRAKSGGQQVVQKVLK